MALLEINECDLSAITETWLQCDKAEERILSGFQYFERIGRRELEKLC